MPAIEHTVGAVEIMPAVHVSHEGEERAHRFARLCTELRVLDVEASVISKHRKRVVSRLLDSSKELGKRERAIDFERNELRQKQVMEKIASAKDGSDHRGMTDMLRRENEQLRQRIKSLEGQLKENNSELKEARKEARNALSELHRERADGRRKMDELVLSVDKLSSSMSTSSSSSRRR